MCGGPLSPTHACARASSRLARETSALVLTTLGDAWRRFMRGDRPLRHAPVALGARLGHAAVALVARLCRATSPLSSCAGRTIGVMVAGRCCIDVGRWWCNGRLMCAATGRTSTHDGARWCGACRGRVRPCGARDFVGGGRRPALAPARLRRCRDG
ncbi:hypothetical protein F511_46353 [Dorcoceras hygrometricum]|uniref:Uncharacterized protein n=1 Tax=Dorcoceras hygrometricum TaxID=472368 RepID=A0A2Z6ZTP8_9LAMI|nr:hypothetical protein F511_46353 [Dorcoceras hygrometricum]